MLTVQNTTPTIPTTSQVAGQFRVEELERREEMMLAYGRDKENEHPSVPTGL